MGFGDMVRKTLWAPVRVLLPKNPWLRVLVLALPFVLLLALFGPALDVVLKLMDLGMRVIEPLLQTTLGRILLLLLVFSLGGLFTVWLLKSRVRDMRAEAVLGRHLQAVADLVGLDLRRSRERFRKVSRYRGPLPDRYPHVVGDSNLKLARLSLEQGRTDEALGWLTRVVEAGLPDELRRSLVQLRVRALRRQGEVLPQALREEVQQAVARFPNDYQLLGDLRDLIVAEGDLHAAAAAQEAVSKHAPPAAAPREHQRLVADLLASGRAHLDAGELEACRKVAKKLAHVDKDGPSSGLLLGDLHRHAGDLRAAVRAYGGTRSPVGLDRIAELLTDHPGAVDERELLESCPLQGTLLLVARELARSGDTARAERAARRAADALGPTPTVCAVLAEVLQLLGKDEKARLLREQAIVRLLSPSTSTSAAAGSSPSAE
jgi:tetratricopeptide (TPR) repeat protein